MKVMDSAGMHFFLGDFTEIVLQSVWLVPIGNFLAGFLDSSSGTQKPQRRVKEEKKEMKEMEEITRYQSPSFFPSP